MNRILTFIICRAFVGWACFSVSSISIANDEIFINESAIVLSGAGLTTVQDVMALRSVERTDWVRWYRVDQTEPQKQLLADCRAQLGELKSVHYRLKDWVSLDRQLFRQNLVALVDSFKATGRVVHYGALDPLRLGVHPSLDRRLRAGDEFEIIGQPQAVVWTWDAVNGFLKRPHAPANTAYKYGADIIEQGFSRGDAAYVVDPHGQIVLAGIARFNRSKQAVAPSSLIFYPPPGFGRSEQSAFQCIARAFSFQRYWLRQTESWRAR